MQPQYLGYLIPLFFLFLLYVNRPRLRLWFVQIPKGAQPVTKRGFGNLVGILKVLLAAKYVGRIIRFAKTAKGRQNHCKPKRNQAQTINAPVQVG